MYFIQFTLVIDFDLFPPLLTDPSTAGGSRRIVAFCTLLEKPRPAGFLASHKQKNESNGFNDLFKNSIRGWQWDWW